MTYDWRRDAATKRTKYRKGDKVRVIPEGFGLWPEGTTGVVMSVERDPAVSTSGISLRVRLSTGRIDGSSDAYWWRKVKS